jgi:hypothetical protein
LESGYVIDDPGMESNPAALDLIGELEIVENVTLFCESDLFGFAGV